MTSPSQAPLRSRLVALVSLRALAAIALMLGVAPVSVDDYFRVFHARWWWEHPGFTSSYEWLPGYLYVFGPLVGLSKDMVLAPRVLTSLLHIGAALAVCRLAPADRGARLLAFALFAFSPLSLVLGTVPLTESLFLVLLASGALLLRRFLETGDARIHLGAAVLYLAAASVRLEGFALAALFGALSLPRRPANVSRSLSVAISLLPLVFPLVWCALLWGVKGDPLYFLGNIREDHFGSGDLAAALVTAEGLVSTFLALAGFSASAVGIAAAIRARRIRLGATELHAVLFACIAVGVVASGDVPSQYPLRLLYPMIAFAMPGLARFAVARLSASPRARASALLGITLAFAAAGFAAVTRDSPLPAEDLSAAAAIHDAIGSGALGEDEHVLIAHDLPSAACLFVYSNDADRVHIDSLGDTCSPKMLTDFESICPNPDWAPRVRLAVVRPGWSEEYFCLAHGWSPRGDVGNWRFYERPAVR